MTTNITRSIDLFLKYMTSQVGCAAHGLAEVYATLTGMAGKGQLDATTA